jgi:Cysteine-rich CPXCG
VNPLDSLFMCAYCFENNSTFIDPSGGEYQRYIEDCQVCCQPNVLLITWDLTDNTYTVNSEPES